MLLSSFQTPTKILSSVVDHPTLRIPSAIPTQLRLHGISPFDLPSSLQSIEAATVQEPADESFSLAVSLPSRGVDSDPNSRRSSWWKHATFIFVGLLILLSPGLPLFV
jgi:hypothetical protein